MTSDMNTAEDKGQPQQEENKPQKAMNTPKEVEESKDQKIDQDFPGYPHYPAKEDVMNQESGMKQADVDVEKLTRSQNTPEY